MRCMRGGQVGLTIGSPATARAGHADGRLAPIGGLPKDLNDLVIPPLQSLTHDDEWLESVVRRGFHSGVLDGLAGYYQR